MYKELIDNLHELRKRTARFRRVALHLHTIDSHDWAKAKGADKDLNSRDKFTGEEGRTNFANKLKEQLDLCAITDHMKCGYATSLSKQIEENDEFVVLPGMEVNFRPEAALGNLRIHLLVILPEGSIVENFARLFEGQINIPGDEQRTGNEEISNIALFDFVERVHNNGGICLAAHVDSDTGVRCRFRQTARETLRLFSDTTPEQQEQENDVGDQLKEYLFNSKLDGIEIHKSSHSRHYNWTSIKDGEKKWIPTVLTFDAHCVEQLGRSERITHLKMTKLGLSGLKDALRFPDTRIRFPDSLPELPMPTLRGIRIIGDSNSFFESLTVAFAENLNCIIGVRGSGKSTLVEALRYVFGYNRSLSDIGQLVGPIRDLQKNNLEGCLIQLVYCTSTGEERVLSATYDEKSDYATKVYTLDGDYCEVADVEASEEYPLRLFGWSEIETLGRSHQRQRELLDRLIPELNPVLEKKRNIRGKLKVNRKVVEQAISEVHAAFEANDNEIRRYSEFKKDFNKLNTEDVKALFSELDYQKEKRALLVQIYENSTALFSDLSSSERKWLQTEVDTILENATIELRDWWVTDESVRLGIVDIESNIKHQLEGAAEKAREFSELVKAHGQSIKKKTDELNASLQKQFEGDTSLQKVADLRANAEGRLKKVEKLRKDYQGKWDNLAGILKERSTLTSELSSTQNEIAGIRARYNERLETTLNGFLPDWMHVSISLKPGGDSEKLSKWLYEVFGARSNQVKNIRQFIEDNISPVDYSEMILKQNFDRLVEIYESSAGDIVISSADLDFNVERTKVTEKDEAADVDVLVNKGNRLSKLLELQETEWDDKEAILLNGVPVNEKSPGQRSSAMLPLIALAEKTPLIIDQPEDNLDKRLVGTVLSGVLAELKEHRQIIVCTHDPNILVGGDAEQIIVLEAESDKKGKVQQHGSIDNNDIIQTVVDLLEGGDEAFARREKRYKDRV